MNLVSSHHPDVAGKRSPAGPGPTATLASFAAGLRFEEIDANARHSARRHIIDTLGAMIAGAGQDATKSGQNAMETAMVGAGPVPVPGLARRYDALNAAWLGGTSAHGLELDDGFRPGSVHPGSVVVPASISLAFLRRSSGAELLTAVVAGYEACCRIAAVSHPRARWRGFHNTGTAGVFGAAVAGASLMKMDAAAVENVIGTAASYASGIFTFLGGGDVKRTHPGHAAREGLMAALLTDAGLLAPRGALEHKEGYFNAYAGGDTGTFEAADVDLMNAGGNHPDSPLAMANCYMKPHACCRHIHPAIDAVLAIMHEDGVTAAEVERVEIGSYAVAASHGSVGWTEMTTAQMSFPFVIATALRLGRVSLSDFSTAHRSDPATIVLAQQIAIEVDKGCEEDYPAKRSARLTVITKDGRKLSRYVPEPLGGARNRLSDEAVSAKFLDLTAPVLGAVAAEEALGCLWNLDQLADVSPVLAKFALGPTSP
jgi:2-methylcitrate dehydratase PrpD